MWGNHEIWMEMSLGSLGVLVVLENWSPIWGLAESEWFWHDTFTPYHHPWKLKIGPNYIILSVFGRANFGCNWPKDFNGSFLAKCKNDRNLNAAQWWDVTFQDGSGHFPKQPVGFFEPEIGVFSIEEIFKIRFPTVVKMCESCDTPRHSFEKNQPMLVDVSTQIYIYIYIYGWCLVMSKWAKNDHFPY